MSAITGVAGVLSNIKKANDKLAQGCANGLKKAGTKLQRASMLLVPVDTGNLKASAYTRAEGSGFKTEVFVGYTANYALFVHELVAMKLKGLPRAAPHKGLYWDPQGRAQAKFLEQPAKDMASELRQTIVDEMKI